MKIKVLKSFGTEYEAHQWVSSKGVEGARVEATSSLKSLGHSGSIPGGRFHVVVVNGAPVEVRKSAPKVVSDASSSASSSSLVPEFDFNVVKAAVDGAVSKVFKRMGYGKPTKVAKADSVEGKDEVAGAVMGTEGAAIKSDSLSLVASVLSGNFNELILKSMVTEVVLDVLKNYGEARFAPPADEGEEGDDEGGADWDEDAAADADYDDRE